MVEKMNLIQSKMIKTFLFDFQIDLMTPVSDKDKSASHKAAQEKVTENKKPGRIDSIFCT